MAPDLASVACCQVPDHVPALAFAAVVLGALLHACWNVSVRGGGGDRRLDTARLVFGSALCALALLPWMRQPALPAWPHLALSGGLHVAYFALLAAAYARARVAVSYPLMRGVAPVVVVLAAIAWFGEALRPAQAAAVAAVAGGVLLLRARLLPGESRAVAYALANSAVIAAYTLNDAQGARLSHAPMAYALWSFALTALPTMAWLLRDSGPRALLRSRPDSAPHARQALRLLLRGVGGGASSVASYALALWAMTRAPVGQVAALRETSMLFGVLLAWALLGERPGRRALLAVLLIAAGAAALA